MYVRQTGTRDIQDRLESVLKQSGVQAITLYGSVDPRRRERWIEDHGYVDTLITHPRLVQTGPDLISFQTVVFYEPEYSLYTLWQALRRVWRLGQTQPDFDVLFQLLHNLQVDDRRRFRILYPVADEDTCDIREDLGQIAIGVKIAFPMSDKSGTCLAMS